jgi:hypothetical protein
VGQAIENPNVLTDGHNLSNGAPPFSEPAKDIPKAIVDRTMKKKNTKKVAKFKPSKLCPPMEPWCLYRNPYNQQTRKQHIFIMRHGERMDHADPSWGESASRPWDPPPLTDVGRWQAL